MSKEFTIFVIDGSQSMNCVGPGETQTDFERALRYVIAYFMQHLFRNRKTDRFALILYSGSAIDVFYQNSNLTLGDIAKYYRDSIQFHEGDKGDTGKFDLIDALDKALGLFRQNIQHKFARNLYLLTNGILQAGDTGRISVFRDMIANYSISVSLSLLSNEKNKETNRTLHRLAAEWKNTSVFKFKELTNAGPSLKLIAPRCVTTGYLGFGELGSTTEGIKDMVHLQVEVFPGTKAPNNLTGQTCFLDPETKHLSKVETSREYYIKEASDLEVDKTLRDNDEEGDEVDENAELVKIPVSRIDCTPGFKYSNRDVLALSPELEEVTTLETTPSINILGFIERNRFPYAYLTDDSFYVVPNQRYRDDNRLSYNSLVQAMIDLNYVGIVRYVAREDSEVQVCVAFPRKVDLGARQGNILVLVRVAMKEDEKIGRFPKLEESKDKIVDDMMEQFIRSKKLRNDTDFDQNVLDNAKIGLTQSLPNGAPVTSDTNIESILLSSNPANKRFHHYLEKILFQSLLLQKPLNEFLQEDKFVEKYLSKDEEHTLLNLNSILDSGEQFLYTSDHDKANDIAVKLKGKLGVKYNPQSKPEKKKARFNNAFGPQPNDGKFDEYFDIEDLLAG